MSVIPARGRGSEVQGCFQYSLGYIRLHLKEKKKLPWETRIKQGGHRDCGGKAVLSTQEGLPSVLPAIQIIFKMLSITAGSGIEDNTRGLLQSFIH